MATDGVAIDSLIEIDSDAPIAEAMTTMASHHLSSLPVVRQEAVSWPVVPIGLDLSYVSAPVRSAGARCRHPPAAHPLREALFLAGFPKEVRWMVGRERHCGNGAQ